MLLETHNSAKRGHKSDVAQTGVMTDNDQAKLKLVTAPKTKRVTPVGCKRPLTQVVDKSSAKVGTSMAAGPAKAKSGKAVMVVHFTEENDKVTFQVEAPDGFLSEGEVGSSSYSEDDPTNTTY